MDHGTSIVDVTDPAKPRYLFHIPGLPGGGEQGGAQMARVCDRQGKTYLLRTSAPGLRIVRLTGEAAKIVGR